MSRNEGEQEETRGRLGWIRMAMCASGRGKRKEKKNREKGGEEMKMGTSWLAVRGDK